jgi:hypothetical protein
MSIVTRILDEGYGPGAWHGNDLKAALADVTPDLAYRRPAPGRHNIAEIALHHAYTIRAVRGQCTGTTPEPFILDGEDWFELDDAQRLDWNTIRQTVADEQARLVTALTKIEAGQRPSPLPEEKRFDLALGITCHAIYHAGQVQLLKRL